MQGIAIRQKLDCQVIQRKNQRTASSEKDPGQGF
jgi:hypothetical protein